MASSQPKFMNTTMRERIAERSGPRRTIFGVRPNDKYYEEKKEIGLRDTAEFPFKGGEQYVGEWSANLKHGFGTQTSVKGNMYEGEWAGGKKHGKGTFWVKEGPRLRKQYAGDWEQDKRHGAGVFIYRNGDRYDGEWDSNKRSGSGQFSYAPDSDLTSYDGGWAEDKRSGFGVLCYANGDRYEGHWLEDKKEGPGRYYYRSTNKVYEGEWVDDIPKCGQYSEAPPGSFADGGAVEEGEASPFQLPSLRLVRPDGVVSEAIATVRQQRAKKLNDPGLRVFDERELSILKETFAMVDPEGSGFVPCSQLHALLQSCGLDISEETVNGLLRTIEAAEDAQINFAEFVDLAAILADM